MTITELIKRLEEHMRLVGDEHVSFCCEDTCDKYELLNVHPDPHGWKGTVISGTCVA